MGEELAVAVAEIIDADLSIFGGGKAILGTLAIAGKEPAALFAAIGQQKALLGRETGLLLAIHHIDERVCRDVA